MALRRANGAELDAFVEAARGFLSRVYGLEVDAREVLPAPAGRLAMSALAACVLRPQDGVLVTEPGYPAFARVAVHHHATIHRAPLDPERGFAPRLDDVGDAPIRLATLNYPNNPTGAMITSGTVEELGRQLAPDAVIFNDAVYGPVTHDLPPQSLLALGDQLGIRQQLLELHSLAKLFALGPQGLSFLVGSERVIGTLREFTEFLWAPPSALQVALSTSALGDEANLARIRAFFSDRIARLRRVLEDGGFVTYPTPAGLYVLCEVPEQVAGHVVYSAQQAADRLFEEYGLAVVGWDVPPHSYFRFSALYRNEHLEALAELLGGGDAIS
jgi:aspartate/methionine/tyrosine aminotransferase